MKRLKLTLLELMLLQRAVCKEPASVLAPAWGLQDAARRDLAERIGRGMVAFKRKRKRETYPLLMQPDEIWSVLEYVDSFSQMPPSLPIGRSCVTKLFMALFSEDAEEVKPRRFIPVSKAQREAEEVLRHAGKNSDARKDEAAGAA